MSFMPPRSPRANKPVTPLRPADAVPPRSPRSPRLATPRRPSSARSTSSACSIQSRDPTGQLRRAAKKAGYSRTSYSYGGGGTTSYNSSSAYATMVANDLMTRAISVGREELVEDTVDNTPCDTSMRRVVVKKVKVPVKRQVKVPVTTYKTQPVTETRRVKVRRLVPVTKYKDVQEEYTVVEQRAVKRDKVVWVKKIVQEEVMEPTTVKKTRVKQVPVQDFKEVEEWQDVDVQVDSKVAVQGYRVDEVEDVKEVEVEEEETYELVPQVRERHILGTRELGIEHSHNHLSRTIGTRILTEFEARELRDLEVDTCAANIDLSGLSQTTRVHIAHVRHWLGITVRQTGGGLKIILVRNGSHAARAGVCVGDWIVNCDGSTVSSLSELRSVISVAGSSCALLVRRGSRNMNFTIRKSGSSSYSSSSYKQSSSSSGGYQQSSSSSYQQSSSKTVKKSMADTGEGVIYSNYPGLSTTTQLQDYNAGEFVPCGHNHVHGNTGMIVTGSSSYEQQQSSSSYKASY